MKLTPGIMSVEQFLKMERDGQLYANDNNVEKWVRKEKHLSKTKKHKNGSVLHLTTAGLEMVKTNN